jgi:hypothetical protein
MVHLVLVVLAIAVVLVSGQAHPSLPSIDFLGSGYNILTGNPFSDQVDPGTYYWTACDVMDMLICGSRFHTQ